ncbi:FecR family protein [Spirochaeta thermophila]|uniref:FecR protein domain-containing protein n=1 Tax=Winmispira thermophila (strain ATCC 49972 / DSM 6192 / RI 19.B1) TaxID=665571 RepID=E0RR45_WINT6|nr:FecR family protein [Spirochaeta thermophila]ADN01623.1 hypothetical protein STHERM_c06640 [Spirochaeta thermophila DSM 6192]
MRRTIIMVSALLLFLGALTAQEQPMAVLEYFDDPSEIEVIDSQGFQVEGVYFGMEIAEGETITTYNSSAELRLSPNGTIIKLAPDTTFKVEQIQKTEEQENRFALVAGKLRAVAAKVPRTRYTITTPTAVCGVRGTDFGILVVPGQEETLFVREGLVAFSRGTEEVMVGAGQMIDALAEVFQPVVIPPETLQDLYEGLEFQVLDPQEVPGQVEEPLETAEMPPAEESPTPQPEPAPSQEESAFMAWLREALGLELGSVTINGQTYSKAVLQPTFAVGKFRASLYLPIIYTRDLFDPSDWYRPKGNDEWSFGTDYDWGEDPVGGVSDFFRDLALKIRYIEYGELRDPFFFKVGNIRGVTTGHGTIMRNYANDTDFPSVRRVGLNMGIDGEKGGTELVVNDLAEPEIMGTRLYTRPLAPSSRLAFGLTALADIDPAGDIPEDSPNPFDTLARQADPVFLNLGLDLDIPLYEGEQLSFILFADLAGMLPYLRHAAEDPWVGSVDSGFQWDALLYVDESERKAELRNYGVSTGLFGTIVVVDYRLEYRFFQGTFRPGFYGPDYDRMRGQYASALMAYLTDKDNPAFHTTTMGIYGEAGFSIVDKVSFQAGYFWPWDLTSSGEITFSDNDFLTMRLAAEKGFIPAGRLKDVSASFLYQRSFFIPTILGREGFEKASLFDANTVFQGEIVWGVAPTLDIAMLVTTNVIYNDDGTVAYDEDGSPKWAPSVTIESRVHF